MNSNCVLVRARPYCGLALIKSDPTRAKADLTLSSSLLSLLSPHISSFGSTPHLGVARTQKLRAVRYYTTRFTAATAYGQEVGGQCSSPLLWYARPDQARHRPAQLCWVHDISPERTTGKSKSRGDCDERRSRESTKLTRRRKARRAVRSGLLLAAIRK